MAIVMLLTQIFTLITSSMSVIGDLDPDATAHGFVESNSFPKRNLQNRISIRVAI